MPMFRPETEQHLAEEVLVDADKKYIVQTLATILMTQVQRPALKQCGTVAKKLITKFPFLKDDEGDGEVSSTQ